jgi:hypothetical protein
MAVSLAVVTTDCVIGLNAGSGYSATVTDPRWTTQQIVDQVLAADGMVVAACIEGQDNPYASGYYSTISGVANGATISSSLGPLVSVQFVLTGGSAPSVRPGVLWDKAEIIAELAFPSLKYDPHFNTDGRVIYHNGAAIATYETATVSVNVITITYTRTSACQAPDTLQWLVFVGAMALLVPVEGENVSAASYWGQLFLQGIEAVRRGQALPPGLEDEARSQLARAA